ncbi:T9SS type A sorting domain-containing protein [Cryomorphaceae bacterium 1068]|nr:T9SS type A sorting domain-containing protein [Cryomorphaceae bacterium 1068]
MRSFYSIILFFSLSAGLVAQPIIDQSNFISVGDVFEYTQILDLTPDQIDVLPEGGEDLTWDFSTLPPVGIELTDSYYPLDSTPELFGLFFGNPFLAGQNLSTFALELAVLVFELPLPLEVEEAYQFYRSDAEGYFITGNAAEVEGLPLISAYDTLDRVFSFPLSFGDMDTNSFYFFTDVPSIGAVGQSGLRSTNADAWGELILPGSSYNCLRVRTELDVTDTIYIAFTETGTQIERPQQINYTWISPEVGGIVAEAIVLQDALVSFRYLTNETALSSTEITDADFKIYPNPGSTTMEISVPSGFEGHFRILDLTGREVKGGRLASSNSVDIATLPEGIYLVSVYNAKTVLTKRLVVSR